MIRKSDKASSLIQYLEGRLLAGAYSDGDRLPSIRYLMKRFDVSYGTAFRGMEYLVEKAGIIRREKNRGYYVRVSPDERAPVTSSKLLAVFLPETLHERSMFAAALSGIMESAEKDGYTLKQIHLPSAEVTAERILAETENCAGGFFLQEYDALLSQLSLRVPAVGIMMENNYDGVISTVNLDPWDAAEMAVEYFQRHQIKHVVISGSTELVYQKRCLCFKVLWQEQGGKCSYRPGNLRTFRKNSGYFFASDSWANNASRFYQEKKGHPLAQDFTVLSVDGKQLLEPEFHRFPTIAVNWNLMGRAAYSEFRSRFGLWSIPPRKIYFRGILVERKE